MVTTVVALKVLVGSFTNMFTYIAGLTRVPRINHHDRDTIKQSLVLQKRAKLSKRPPSKFGSKLFVSSFRPQPNISQILDSNTFTTLFSSKDNNLLDRGIKNFLYTLNFLEFDRNLLNNNFGLNSLNDLKGYIMCMVDIFNDYVDEFVAQIKDEF